MALHGRQSTFCRGLRKSMVDTLVDAGPLIALLNSTDSYHTECRDLFRRLDRAFYTTLPAITEAMHFVGKHGGNRSRQALCSLIHSGDLLIEHPSPHELIRMCELIDKYSDCPMDFADASLVALAERLGLTRIFTVDYNDFSTYRLQGNRLFTIIGPRP
jgi:predicted nucleic acid-binding protein